MSHLHEECGVVGVYGDREASNIVYLGLCALQHRGQEACGIVAINPSRPRRERISTQKAFGLVVDGFTADLLAKMRGPIGVGHVRYSTQGGRILENIQPLLVQTSLGPLALAHNGNLTNATLLRRRLEARGSIFHSTSDTEVFVHLFARSAGVSELERIREVLGQIDGAYSLVLASTRCLYGIRDPFGFRPLVIGRRGGAYVLASETCALDLVEATPVREVEPGEIVEIGPEGLRSHRFAGAEHPHAFCAFEPIYFARPDSRIFRGEIYELRRRMGEVLAIEAPALADLVVAVPDSGVPMAMGFSRASGLPLELGLVRNHYVGRTFIEPTQEIRGFGVKIKLNPVASILNGKRVAVIDDSIVRGNTMIKILRMLRKAGARELHVRIGSPPITHSCYYGVDTPLREKLLAAREDVDGVCREIGADSLGFLSLEGLKRALGPGRDSYCYACFTGRYPERIHARIKPQPTDGKGPGYKSSGALRHAARRDERRARGGSASP